jgi:hypothetical protein
MSGNGTSQIQAEELEAGTPLLSLPLLQWSQMLCVPHGATKNQRESTIIIALWQHEE